ncbi:MAG: hypothetical protein IIB69_06000 [Proteobacteria bacterium]|nr:hypothetical protein [Pseudomonadota bacterium]MCH8176827.1 hypothetical protein [Pseudomonadota bacterium]
MLTKILFTLAVITGCFWYVSAKRGHRAPPILVIASKKDLRKRKLLRRSAYLFMGFMMLAAIAMIYIEISDNNTLVTVHVINSQTGSRVSYQARRQDIKSSSFTTLEGSTVYVANIERIEVDSQ